MTPNLWKLLINGSPSELVVVWRIADQIGAVDGGGYQSRNHSTVKLIEAACVLYELHDLAPRLVFTGDRPFNEAAPAVLSFSYCRAEGFFDVPVPDFMFDGYQEAGIGDYEQVTAAMAQAGAEPAASQKLGWIGNCQQHPVRQALLRIGRGIPGLMDIRDQGPPVEDSQAPGSVQPPAAYMSLVEQVKQWAYLIDVEGRGYSGRLKLLLHAGRPVFIQDRPWREWYWDELEPMKHYIPVRRDLSDLPDRLRWVLANPAEAAAIGLAGQRHAQSRLTRAAALRVWAESLLAAQNHPPELWAPLDLRNALEPALKELGAPTV